MEINVFQLLHSTKTFIKQVVPTAYTLEQMVFAAAIFQGLWVVSFQTKLKKVWYTLLHLSLSCISSGQKTN